MNKGILTLLLLVFPIALMAQKKAIQPAEYQVYRLVGEVFKVVKKDRKPIAVRDTLHEKDVISLAENSEIKLVNMADSTMVTLRDQCAGSIATLIEAQKDSKQLITPRYLAFIKKQLFGNGYNEQMATGRSTAVYRTDLDSLLVSTDTQQIVIPCQYDVVEHFAVSLQNILTSSRFEIPNITFKPIDLVGFFKKKNKRKRQ